MRISITNHCITAFLCLICGFFPGITHPAEVSRLGSADSIFVEHTWAWGLVAQHQQRRDHLTGLTDTLGAGACVLDVDSDGWVDVLLVGGSGQRRDHGAASWWQASVGHRLFHNRQGAGFEDITASSGLGVSWGMGCASGDFDRDGDEDVLITGYNDTQLFENLGAGNFAPVENSGIDGAGWATSATIADVDGDGWLDIYLNRFVDYQRGQRTFEARSGFRPGTPVDFESQLYVPLPNLLLHNEGGLRFEDIGKATQVSNPEGRSLQALWSPQTRELLVLNARGSPLVGYQRTDSGQFKNSLQHWRSTIAEGAYGGAFLPGSGVARALVSTAAGDASGLIVRGDEAPNIWDLGLMQDRQLALQGWGVAVADFNNDGLVDVLMASGHLVPDPDAPDVPLGQPDVLHMGNADGRFQLQESGIATASSRAAIALDANNDGAMDVIITRNNDAPQLLLNRANNSGHWLGFSFVNTQGRPITQGVQLRLQVGDAILTSGYYRRGGFLSTADPRLHIGLGEESVIGRIEVSWPDGGTSEHPGVAVDQYFTIQQGSPDPQPLSLATMSATPVLAKQHSYRRAFGDTYVRLLVRGDTTTASSAFLRDITREDPAALRAAISALPPEPDPSWLYLLERGLASREPATTSAALAVLQTWELEASVLRLLPLLAHHDVAIQCQTAELFRHWFHEEEAVIQRKLLALTPLVRLLDDDASQAQICAMAALAEAERFRGFHRLAQLTRDSNPSVALAAVQTLGRIRQREAIPVLQTLAAGNIVDPAMGPAIEYALSLLAAPGTDPMAGGHQAAAPATPSALPDPAVQALLVLYRNKERSAERQLLTQLDTLATAAAWQDLLSRLPTDSARTRRVLMKGVFHRDAEIQRLAIDYSEPLLRDPGLAATLWRRVESPALKQEVRLVLIDKLGQHDANRMLLLLDRIEPSP